MESRVREDTTGKCDAKHVTSSLSLDHRRTDLNLLQETSYAMFVDGADKLIDRVSISEGNDGGQSADLMSVKKGYEYHH